MQIVMLNRRESETAAQLDAESAFDVEASEWTADGYRECFRLGGEVAVWQRPVLDGHGKIPPGLSGLPMGIASWYVQDDSGDYPLRAEPVCVCLMRFGILPDYRRIGQGTAFFNALLAKAWQRKGRCVTRVWLYARRENGAAHAFWESLDFVETGEAVVDDATYKIYQLELREDAE